MLLDIPKYDEKMIENMTLDSITADEINISLENYQNIYKDCLTNNSQRNYFNTSMRGLLSNIDRKTIEPIALAFMGETEIRGFQQFFKRSKLQDDTLLRRYQETLSKAVSSPEGMICVDGSGI